MDYTSESHIKSVKNIKLSFHSIVFDRKVNFHPDYSFGQYICLKAHEPDFHHRRMLRLCQNNR